MSNPIRIPQVLLTARFQSQIIYNGPIEGNTHFFTDPNLTISLALTEGIPGLSLEYNVIYEKKRFFDLEQTSHWIRDSRPVP